MSIKRIIKEITPPILVEFLKPSARYGWFGNYSSWNEAKKECVGYDADAIFNKVKGAALRVKNGEAKYERDSVLFYEEQYNWQLLACLMLIASRNNGTLHVIDFGGSLGSFFYQHRKPMGMLKDLKWGVVEQPHFVNYGKENLATEEINFYYTIDECLQNQGRQTLLLSSVLQYLEKPFEVINDLLNIGFEYILIDRTAFTKNSNHEITIQKIAPEIYDASYPAWFFNENKFLEMFTVGYNIFFSFKNEDFTNKKGAYFKGFLLIKKSGRND